MRSAQLTSARRQREFEREKHGIAERLEQAGQHDAAKWYRYTACQHGEAAALLEGDAAAPVRGSLKKKSLWGLG